ncbi:unnamed protein product, partial [Heterotrigona itama]
VATNLGANIDKQHFPSKARCRFIQCLPNKPDKLTWYFYCGKIYALGGYNGRTRMSSGERYEPQKNQWEMIPPMHQQRSDASAAALHDKIYIVGGFSGREVLNSAEVFDVESNQWTYIHSMINPRSGVSLVAFRDSLYALGGFNGIIRLNS